MSSVVFVGYRLAGKRGLDLDAVIPEFKPHGLIKDQLKKLADVQAKEEKWRENSEQLLYTGELAEVQLIGVDCDAAAQCDPRASVVRAYFKRGEWCDSPFFAEHLQKPIWSVALQMRHWLLSMYGRNWLEKNWQTMHSTGEVLFVGFDVKQGIKVLGIDCALTGNPLPLPLWYSSSDYRDMESAIVPSEWATAGVGLRTALTCFEAVGTFDGVRVPADYVPGKRPVLDAEMCLRLGVRLGMVPEYVLEEPTEGSLQPSKRKKAHQDAF